MRSTIFIGLIAAAACATFAVRARSQDMGATNLGDYLGKERLSPPNGSDNERKRLAATYDNGVAAYQNKQYDRAISAFTTLLQNNLEAKISAVIYVARAQSYVGKHELKKGIADATQAIHLNGNLAIAYNTRGVALGRMGDFNSAIKDFDVAIKLNPRLTDAQRNRALAERYLSQRSAPKRTTKTR
jgi:tetratricopeptide (TPR) repeat protein